MEWAKPWFGRFREKTGLTPGLAGLEFGERNGLNPGSEFGERTWPNPNLELGSEKGMG